MKKLLIVTTLVLASAASADARVNVDIGLFAPAPYYEPAPVYYAPPPHLVGYYNGRDRHRQYDWNYWRENERHDNHDNDHGRGHDERGRR